MTEERTGEAFERGVIDRDGTIAGAEYVADQMSEPDDDAAVDSARAALAG